MSRSSIFNFEFGWLRDVTWKAPLLALSVIGALEIVVRSNAFWGRVPDSMVGAYGGIQHEIIEKAPITPEIVFLGSSRMRDAVDPRQLEGAMALRPHAVMNLGLTGGTPYEALSYYERNRALLGRAKVVVIGVEDWYWNGSFPPDEVERLDATFGTRITWYERRHELGDVIGGLWRTTEVRDELPKWAISFVRRPVPPRFVDDRLIWRPASATLEVGPEETDVAAAVSDLLQNYRPAPAYESSLTRLFELLEADHVRVIVVQLPMRAAYYDAVQRAYPRAQPYMAERIDALAKRFHFAVQIFTRGTDLGITDNRFYDYGHLTEDGCRRMTSVWASIVGESRE
jgi:hypothetical protein